MLVCEGSCVRGTTDYNLVLTVTSRQTYSTHGVLTYLYGVCLEWV